ncbi:DNA polymerase III subunit gamma/tau [Allocoleopsis sp.]|uniref:DNA polymerase III subunit gamma/tau n=1 Tax=Allocoleopsis sp. TaxID=3088169 RepID=UPI002FD46813
MSYEPLHHKYRPQTFADLVGQEAIATTLINAILTERIAPAYLFTGPRGTGKTSSARILAKSLNCLKQDKPTDSPCGRCGVCTSITAGSALDVIEIDAASNTGVDNIREIIERAQFAPVQCRYKVYVVDECHMLSTAAFNALLKTLEEPPKHVVFVLATTDPQRVLPTIISRCQKFDFRRIPLQAMVQHLQDIARKENINITPDALTLVAQVAQGGLRDAESLLDQLSLLPGEVAVEQVWDLVGAVPERDLLELTRAIASDNSEAVLDSCRRLMDRGREPLVVLQNLAGFYRDLLIARTAPNRGDLVAITTPTWDQLCQFAQDVDTSRILQGQQHLKNSEVQIKNTTQPRLWLEVTLLGLLPAANPASAANPTPVSHLSAKGRQDLQASRNPPLPASSPRHEAPGGERPVESGIPPVVSSQLQTPSSDQFTAPNSASNPQAIQSQSMATAVRTSAPSTSVQSPTSNTSTAIARDLEQPLEVNAPNTTAQAAITQSLTSEASESPYAMREIWQQVLEHLQPFATQALLRQHCQLISFEGLIAHVGVSSQPLMKLAQERLPNIEAAFEAVYKSKVKVSLKTKGTKSLNIDTGNEATARRVVPEPISQAAVTQPVNNDLPSQISTQLLPARQEAEKETEVHRTRGREGENTALLEKENPRIQISEQGDALTEPAARFSLTEPPKALSVQQIDLDVEDMEKVMGNLKQFFEGEIVDLGDDFSNREPVSTKPLDTEETIAEDTEQLEVELEEDEHELSLSQLTRTRQWQASELAALEDADVQKRLENVEYDEDGDIPF